MPLLVAQAWPLRTPPKSGVCVCVDVCVDVCASLSLFDLRRQPRLRSDHTCEHVLLCQRGERVRRRRHDAATIAGFTLMHIVSGLSVGLA